VLKYSLLGMSMKSSNDVTNIDDASGSNSQDLGAGSQCFGTPCTDTASTMSAMSFNIGYL
jgi:hypothetical protein